MRTDDKTDPTDIPGTGRLAILKRTYVEFKDDHLTDWAAALTYYAVLSLFPALLALVALVGIFGQYPQTTDALLNMTGTQLDEVGNTEMLNWAVMFGAIGRQPGELIDYIPTWHHGLSMMRFLPARKVERKLQGEKEFGGFQFRNEGFQFYKHPPAEAYGLNKLMFESRHSEQLRDRIVDHFDEVADEYGLTGQQREAAGRILHRS